MQYSTVKYESKLPIVKIIGFKTDGNVYHFHTGTINNYSKDGQQDIGSVAEAGIKCFWQAKLKVKVCAMCKHLTAVQLSRSRSSLEEDSSGSHNAQGLAIA